MLCTQITGRLEDKEEYGYSREMKQLIVEVREWLGRVDGYGFLRPCALKRAHECYQLLIVSICMSEPARRSLAVVVEPAERESEYTRS